MRKPTIEQRIARLEKLLSSRKSVKKESRNANRRIVKNESALQPNMHEDLLSIFDNRFCGGEYFGSHRNFKDNMWAASQGENDRLVDDAIMWLVDDFGYDEEELEDLRDDIADDLAEMADDMIHDYDDWDEDESEYDESAKRSFGRKSVRNEGMKQLPNGMTANRVCDVLATWAGTSRYDKDKAITELGRRGILTASKNKWYDSEKAVAEAIADCWDDQIGAIGEGAAQFCIGDIGGVTHCSLTLWPITGGDSRARNLVLKFNWPDEMM